MSVSVLICTFNRHEFLHSALTALIDETLEKPDQVVVVNGGDERADRVVEAFQRRPGVAVELIKTVNENLAASRNLGLPRCTGDIVAMTDDDARVFPDWVAQIKRAHREFPQAGAVGGPVLPDDPGSLLSQVAGLVTFPSWDEIREVRTLPGVNVTYKRQAIEQVGPQDEALFRGEDVDFNWRILQLGYPIIFAPFIRVYHHHRPTLPGLLEQHYMYGRAYYLVRRKWPEMYAIYPRSLRTFHDFLKALNVLAGLFYHPFQHATHIPALHRRLLALPLLFAAGLSWRLGMLDQFLRLRLARA